MKVCYSDQHWYPACTTEDNSSPGSEDVTCMECIDRMILTAQKDLDMWTQVRDKVKERLR